MVWAPDKLAVLVQWARTTLPQAAANNPVNIRRRIVAGYKPDAVHKLAALAAACQFAVTVNTRWSAYHDSFSALSKAGGTPPRQLSYYGDHDEMEKHQRIFTELDVDDAQLLQLKQQWVSTNLAQPNHWQTFGLVGLCANPAEEVNSLKGRAKVLIRANLTKGYNWMYRELHIQNNSNVHSWGLGSGRHVTIIKRYSNETWRMDIDAQRALAIRALFNADVAELHATLELHAQSDPRNPKLYYSRWRDHIFAIAPLPAGANPNPLHLTADQLGLVGTLSQRINQITAAINNSAIILRNRLVIGWENA